MIYKLNRLIPIHNNMAIKFGLRMKEKNLYRFLYVIFKLRFFGHVKMIANSFSLKWTAPTHFPQNCDL